ncbi:MAG: hypothetical protein JSW05_02695, partial [Candidatus Thorarchaeota archaeon]
GDFDVAADICNPWLYYTSPNLNISLCSVYLDLASYSTRMILRRMGGRKTHSFAATSTSCESEMSNSDVTGIHRTSSQKS